MKKMLLVLFLGFLSFNILGCSTFGNKQSNKPLQAIESQSVLRFSDVPVPSGFKILMTESYSFESSGVRVGMLKYQGKAGTEQVINFYKEQMPMYNWDLLNSVAFGNCMLNFERESESCIINLAPKGSLIVITVSLGPKSKGIQKKSGKIIK